jgi:hypothetical protein
MMPSSTPQVTSSIVALVCGGATVCVSRVSYQHTTHTEITDVNERLVQLKALVSQLPESRRNILHRLVQSLVVIAENSEENKMDPSNLAIVFGPSLLRAESDGLDIIFKIRAQCLVIENCIQHHAAIFLVRPDVLSPLCVR